MANSGGARRKRVEPSSARRSLGIRAAQPKPKDLRELLAVRNELAERISRKRRSIRATFAAAGVPIAAVLAEAASGTIRAFLEASEGDTPSSKSVRALAQALGVSPFAVSAALNLELSEMHRFYLSVQIHRLDALARALVSA